MEEPVKAPITVLVDTAESHPYTFENLRADADKQFRPLAVSMQYECLGRHPHSLGDYSVDGYLGRIHVERKSMEDAQGTVLGWETEHDLKAERTGRRERFEKELDNLSKIEYGLVVVEATLGDCVARMPQWGTKDSETNAKIFHRSVMSYLRRYRVHWLFCDSRRHAEKATYSWLFQCWREAKRKDKETARIACQI